MNVSISYFLNFPFKPWSDEDKEKEDSGHFTGTLPSQVEKIKPTFGKKNNSINQNYQSSFQSTNQKPNEDASSFLNSCDTG